MSSRQGHGKILRARCDEGRVEEDGTDFEPWHERRQSPGLPTSPNLVLQTAQPEILVMLILLIN